MRAFATLLRRELVSRRALLVASLAMGILVAIFPYLAGGRGVRAEEFRGAAAVGVALIWSTVLVLGLGATCLARDLGERRLGGDFRLPASATAIWGARLLGAYVTALAAGAAELAVPAAFGLDLQGASAGLDFFANQVVSPADRGPLELEGVLVGLPLVFAFLLLVANAIGLAVFAARAWSGLDLLSMVVAVGAGALLRQGYLFWGADDAGRRTLLVNTAVATAGLLAGSWWQVVGGRTEGGRAHSRASIALLGAVLAGAAGGALAYVRYVRPSIESLAPEGGRASLLSGDLAALGANVPGRTPLFRYLIDRNSGATLQLGPAPFPAPTQDLSDSRSLWASGTGGILFPAISQDAHRVAWIERERAGFGRFEDRVFVLEHRTDELRATPSELSWPQPPLAWALSPDGRAVATRWSTPSGSGSASRIVIEELAGGGSSRTFEVQDCDHSGPIAYLENDRLRVSCGRGRVPLDDTLPFYDLREVHLPSGTQVRGYGSLGSGWLDESNRPIRGLDGPGWALQVRVSGPDRRWAGWELVTSKKERQRSEFERWTDPYTGPWPTDGMAIGRDRILVILERPARWRSSQIGGRWVPVHIAPGSIEVLLLATTGERIRGFQLDQPLTRILSIEGDAAAAVLVGDRRRWGSDRGPSRFAVRLDLSTGDPTPLEISELTLPHPAVHLPARATRDPDGHWKVGNSPSTVVLLFPNEPFPPPGPWRLRSTGQVETPLGRR